MDHGTPETATADTTEEHQTPSIASTSTESPFGGAMADLSDDQKSYIKEAFDLFDPDGTGFMDVTELRYALSSLGYETRTEEVKRQLLQIYKDGLEFLSFVDFIQLIQSLPKKDNTDEILKAFRLFDKDGNGAITSQDLRLVFNEVGEPVSEQELQEMINCADLDHDGVVSQDEFVDIMKKVHFF